MPISKAEHDAICRRLTDDGKLIEAGFQSLRFLAVPADASAVQIEEMRNAFFAGARHLFASILSIMEAGAEPTENDLNRMSIIEIELSEFVEQYKRRFDGGRDPK